MKSKINIISLIIMLIAVIGCSDYLDVVPDNTPTLEDAFKNRSAMEKSLFTCYSYLPDPTNPFYYPSYFSSRDEFEGGTSNWVINAPSINIAKGNQNSNSPYLNYWGGENGGAALFQAIRVCNTFIENAHIPRDIEEYEREKWIAEAKFLKAYYHFFLMQLYGPIPIIKNNLSLSASPDEVKVFREPVDEVVDYIVQLIDEATTNLPFQLVDITNEEGRITQPIALSVKAKVLVWAASPIFNGNQYYAEWVDSRGKQLVSPVESVEKWQKAARAIKNAIDTCHLAGHRLFEYAPGLDGFGNMSDSLRQLMTIRKAVTQRTQAGVNKGVIWASTETFRGGKGGMGSYPAFGDFQRALFPQMYAEDISRDISKLFASFNMAELFYSNKGIPIEEDTEWGYADRYSIRTSTEALNNQTYIELGQPTAHLHFNREPRFYANLGFDRGYYELASETDNNGASFKTALKMRFSEVSSNANHVGYYVKKLVAFESSASKGSNNAYSGYQYRFPLIRLSDLYLLYSEALNETKNSPDAEVYTWIDEVRRVAGLDGVEVSWKNSTKPNRPYSKTEMRKIIQQERLIELAFEGQRFWDVRRWLIAENLWNKPQYSWNVRGETANEYYTKVVYWSGRDFLQREYLWPLKNSDVRQNKNLVQTHGW